MPSNAKVVLVLALTFFCFLVSNAKPFLDLQFDLKLSKPPKDCRKEDHRGRCVLAYTISLLESFGDFDLQAVMLQEGHVTQLTERRKHFREDTIVAVPNAVRINRESHLYVGIKFYGLSHDAQDYFVIDATRLLRHSASTKVLAAIDTDDISFAAVLRRGKIYHDSRPDDAEPNSCECVGYTCGCCAHLDIPKIELNETGCLNLTYLPNDYGISFTLSLNGRVVYNNTISARNPPAVCFGAPFLKEFASLCVKFYDLDITEKTFSGCVKMEAELYHVRITELELGCFHLGPFRGRGQTLK